MKSRTSNLGAKAPLDFRLAQYDLSIDMLKSTDLAAE
jgi:hypothetical protein